MIPLPRQIYFVFATELLFRIFSRDGSSLPFNGGNLLFLERSSKNCQVFSFLLQDIRKNFCQMIPIFGDLVKKP
jgi:hypothetical protein